MAGNSVVSKKEQELMDKESKLVEQYYRNYRPQDQDYQHTPQRIYKPKMADYSEEKSYNMDNRKRHRQNRNSDFDDISYTSPNVNKKKYSKSKIKKKVDHDADDQYPEELDEGEKMSLIAKLEKRKSEVWVMIQKLPICRRTHAIEQREKELYNNLDEITAQLTMLNHNRILVV